MHSSSIPFHARATTLCIGLALAALSFGAQAAQYTVKDLGSLAPGLFMQATSINDSGQVAGFAYGGQYVLGTVGFNLGNVGGQAFVTGTNGQGLTALSNLAGDSWSQANAINNAGQVAGTSGVSGSANTHAFVTAPSSTTAQNVGSLGGTSSNATGINASGQVVGTSTLASGATQGYITTGGPSGGTMQALTALPAVPYITITGVNAGGKAVGYLGGTFANDTSFVADKSSFESLSTNSLGGIYAGMAINDQGQTAGSYSQYRGAGGIVPFLRNSNGTITLADMSKAPNYLVNAPRGQSSSAIALDLNAKGQLVGSISRNDFGALGHTYAFITDANAASLVEVGSLNFTDFTAPKDFYFTSATGINDFGAFVANGSNGHAYLITSVPEPGTALTLLCGLLPIAGLAKARQRNSDRA